MILKKCLIGYITENRKKKKHLGDWDLNYDDKWTLKKLKKFKICLKLYKKAFVGSKS